MSVLTFINDYLNITYMESSSACEIDVYLLHAKEIKEKVVVGRS